MTAESKRLDEVFCLASGPSLNAVDVEAVRQWRAGAEGRAVVVTNTTFRMAPWADFLFAMDRAWWKVHHEEVARVFKGSGFSLKAHYGAEATDIISRNSGAGAINFARSRSAMVIYLLGYDCQHTGGRRHWHGDHPKNLSNAHSVGEWSRHFADIARRARNTTIINCSRESALRCFPRRPLEEVLNVENAR